MDALNLQMLKDILEEMKNLRDRWVPENGSVDDAEEMWTEIPDFLIRAVPVMEKALGEEYSRTPLEIVRARYGYGERYIDVTNTVQKYATPYQLKVMVSNELFGDPVFGQRKDLIVLYKLGDEEAAIRAFENETLIIPMPKE